MKNFGFAVLLSALIPAVALAGGGGGSKAASFINVKNVNVAGLVLGVIVDPPGGLAYVIPASIDAFKKDGGKVLNPGETASFSVKEGKHLLGGAYIGGLGAGPKGGLPDIHVGKKATVNVDATPSGPVAPAPIFTVK